MTIGADTYFQDPESMQWGKGAPPEDAPLNVMQMVGLLYLPNGGPTTLGETVILDDGARGYVLVTEPPVRQTGGMGGMDLLSAGSLTRVVDADDFLTREVRVSVVGLGHEAGDIVAIRYHGFGQLLSIEPPENYIELLPETFDSGVQEPTMVLGLARNGDGNVEVTFSKPVFVQGEIVLYVLEPSTGGWELPLLSGSGTDTLIFSAAPEGKPSPAGWRFLRLHPLSQSEIHGGIPNFLDDLFCGTFETSTTSRLADDLPVRITAGGYPAALARPTPRRRANWYRNFVDTQLQRDVRDMARISSLDVLPRLLSAASSQTARLFNLSDMASPFQLSRPTIDSYIQLLERLFLIYRLPPWHGNRLSRLVKSPKLHIGDTGLGCALIGSNPGTLAQDRALLGQFLETFVFQELKRQAICQEQPMGFYHYRDKDQVEVDVVIEQGAMAVAGIEIKASATVSQSDFRGLRKLKKVVGDRFAAGVVFYDGAITASFGDAMFAVPIRSLCEGRVVGLGSFVLGIDRLAP